SEILFQCDLSATIRLPTLRCCQCLAGSPRERSLFLFISSASLEAFDLLRLTGNSDIGAVRLPFISAPTTGAALIRPSDAGGIETPVIVEVLLNLPGSSRVSRVRGFLG